MKFLDGIAMRAIASEMRMALMGGRITKILQPDSSSILLQIRPGGFLFLSIDPSMPRIYVVKGFPKPSSNPPGGFCALLRKFLEGGKVIGVEQDGLDRVIRLRAESGPDVGFKLTLNLVVEIMGRHSNAILVDEGEGRILGSMKAVTEEKSRYRQILPGLKYIPPPPQEKLDPMSVGFDEFLAMASSGANGITNGIMGIGRHLAERIYIALEREGEERAWEWFEEIRRRIADDRFDPVLVLSPSGDPVAAFPFPVPLRDEEAMERVESMSDAIRTISDISLEREFLERERKRVLSILSSSLDKMRNALARIEEDLFRIGDPEIYKVKGQAILSNIGSIEKGMRIVSLRNLWDPQGQEVEVELDPSLTPSDNANVYFQRFKKAKESLEAIKRRKEEVLEEIRYLEGLESIAKVASSPEELSEIWEEMMEAGIVKGKRRERGISGPREYVSPDGWKVVVGRNGIQNDRILSEASPNDIWMHARGIPGSHVILSLPFKPKDLSSVPPEAIEVAAKAAAYFSSGRGSGKVEVDMTFRKHVRKVKGSKPGFVTYSNERTIVVYPDPEVGRMFEGGEGLAGVGSD
jgi:predicted ribosome quality control (RQC) complex YloA/Tae2 family protein